MLENILEYLLLNFVMVDFGRRPRGHIGDRSKKKIGATLNKMSVCYRHPPAQIFCYHLLIEDDTFSILQNYMNHFRSSMTENII